MPSPARLCVLSAAAVACAWAVRAVHSRLDALRKALQDAELTQRELEAQLESSQRALEVMNRAQRGVARLGLDVPPRPAGLVPTEGWRRCVAALEAVDAGYSKWAGREHKTLLISNYDDQSPAEEASKRRVNELITSHLRRLRPELAAQLRSDDALCLLLLEAPGCGTTSALLQELPELATLGHKVYVPQADPTHYAAMVNRCAPCGGCRGSGG